MSLHRAARAHGSRQPRKARLYLLGAGIGLSWVLRLCDIPSHSVPPAGAVAGMASLIGSTIGGALVGYSLWWVAWRTGLLPSPGPIARFVVYCHRCRRAMDFPQAMQGSWKKCPSCGTKQRLPQHPDPRVIPLDRHGVDMRHLP